MFKKSENVILHESRQSRNQSDSSSFQGFSEKKDIYSPGEGVRLPTDDPAESDRSLSLDTERDVGGLPFVCDCCLCEVIFLDRPLSCDVF